MEAMTSHDIEMARVLLTDLQHYEVAEKFELPLYDFAYTALDCDFKMTEKLFFYRLKRDTVRLSEDAIERWCGQCDEFYPFTHEFWHKNATTADGAHCMCRSCELLRGKRKRGNR